MKYAVIRAIEQIAFLKQYRHSEKGKSFSIWEGEKSQRMAAFDLFLDIWEGFRHGTMRKQDIYKNIRQRK